MSAASVSRTGLPFSQLSVTASISRCSSMASAILFSTAARCAPGFSPHSSLAAWAASRASSTSSGVDSATSQIGFAVAGLRLTRYLPIAGGSHFPPMKFSYLGCTLTRLPVCPGGVYFMTFSSHNWRPREEHPSGTSRAALLQVHPRPAESPGPKVPEAAAQDPRGMAGVGIVGSLLAFVAFGRKGFGTGAFESVMVTLAVVTIGFGIAALIAETVWALLVPMVTGLVLMWGLALMHDAGYVAPDHAAGHA